jgi:23S rRNA (cytidine1920-2'-O)/16S rRNA (cytidine1409-2'-O)-methyltransferase
MPRNRTKKVRLDTLLHERGLFESREKARAMILAGNVLVEGRVADKAGSLVRDDLNVEILNTMRYVSRGGIKLEKALGSFNITVSGKIAMDIGSSTGGFTDCLLQKGAKKVYSVDVGYGQLHWNLRNDPCVVVLEKTNIRYLRRSAVKDIIDIVTIDVSFISLLKVIPKALEFLGPDREIIALIKPQFEAGKSKVGKGGVVRDETTRQEVLERIKVWAISKGLDVKGVVESPLSGSKGNIEYFIHLVKTPRSGDLLDAS